MVGFSHFPATVTKNAFVKVSRHLIRGASQSALNLVRKSHASAGAEKALEEQEWSLRGAKPSTHGDPCFPTEMETLCPAS